MVWLSGMVWMVGVKRLDEDGNVFFFFFFPDQEHEQEQHQEKNETMAGDAKRRKISNVKGPHEEVV